MFEDKDDIRHLFMCQTAIGPSDGHGSTLNVVYFLSVFFGLVCWGRKHCTWTHKKLIVIRQLN